MKFLYEFLLPEINFFEGWGGGGVRCDISFTKVASYLIQKCQHFHYFSTKTEFVDTLEKHLMEASLMSTHHYEKKPIQIYWKFYHKKNENFQIKILIFFHISAQNIDSGYSLELPQQGRSNKYPQQNIDLGTH